MKLRAQNTSVVLRIFELEKRASGTRTQNIGPHEQDVDEGAPVAMTLLGECDGLQEASTIHAPTGANNA
jgi:hypothetical protein